MTILTATWIRLPVKKNTLHDTVGIAYQDLLPTNDQDMHILQIDKAEDSSLTRTKERRSYEAIDLDLEPYHKKPKI